MAITTAYLQEKLKEGVKDVEFLSVTDTSDGCGAKFAVVIVAKSFDGMTAVERHQAILGNGGVLGEEMKTIHALELKAWTPKQYAKRQAKAAAAVGAAAAQ